MPAGSSTAWKNTMLTITGASRVSASGTKRLLKSRAPAKTSVVLSSGNM
jgi:hypothetical protein